MVASPAQKTPLTGGENASLPSSTRRLSNASKAAPPKQFLLTWSQEVLACVGFVAALIALFITIYQYQNRPSPDWPDWLSLNSIIAIYLVLLKSCVLLVTAEGLGQLKWSWFASDSRALYDIVYYDAATRGPWGAAGLIWKLRLRHLLASLGALVTLLTLVVDPAAQQIVRFDECQVIVPGARASLPRTNYWGQGGSSTRVGPGLESTDPAVRKAIDAGIAGTYSPIIPECATGNCTWSEDYGSLGWGTVCEDISEQLVRTNRTFRVPWNGNETITRWTATFAVPDGGIRLTQSTNVSYPELKYAAMGAAPINIGGPSRGVAYDFILGGSGSAVYPPNANPLTGNVWDDCDDSSVDSEKEWRCRGYGAARCWVFPATKVYNATVRAGQLNDTVIPEDADNAWGTEDGIYTSSLDTKCITAEERTALVERGYVFEPGRRWLAYNSTTSDLANDTTSNPLLQRGCQYVYWQPSVTSVQSLLGREYFTGRISGLPPVYGTDPSALKGTQALQTIYNYGNVSFSRVYETFWNMTLAMDNHVRLSGSANYSAPALGTVNQEKTCIRIRWAWMAYPAVLVVLALTFFVAVAVRTWPKGVVTDAWKISPLALLYHGLVVDGASASFSAEQLEGTREMEAHARKTVVRLAGSDGGRTGLEVQ